MNVFVSHLYNQWVQKMNVVNLDMMNNQTICSRSSDNSIENIRKLEDILNDLRYRITALEEKEKAREQQCVCETLL